MTSLSDALASCARQTALEQRARLLEAVWDDVQDESRSVLLGMLPRRFLPGFSHAAGPLGLYAVDLGCGADGSWCVLRDHARPHPGAALLEAPMLAVFLPCLCRRLLGQSLLMPSMPVWWLGDRATLAMLAARPKRFCLRDGTDPERAPISLADLPASGRIALQSEVDRAPHRYVATLGLENTLRNSNIVRRSLSEWRVVSRD